MEEEIYIWELPYWKVLEVRSAIDVIHVMKNLCVNLLGFLGVYGKTKDTPEARQDQKRVKERDGMVDPELFEGPGSYALTKEEKEIFWMPEKYQGPAWLLVKHKGNTKYGRLKVPELEVSWLPRD